jgi:anhydro-N-acetylmuramic acid kinase
LNLGGIANLTLLPPARGPEAKAPVLGWDCGPANTLLDLAAHQFSGGQISFDANGTWARQGQPDEDLIKDWLKEAYFLQAPPKSTGRELFGRSDLSQRLAAMQTQAQAPNQHSNQHPNPANALATLTAFSAAVIAQDLAKGPPVQELLVAGGGCRNGLLMEELQRRCRGTRVRPLAELGIGESDREALAFALLAWWHAKGYPGNLPSVTGASRRAVLGVCVNPA